MVARSLQMALVQPCMLPVEPSREALMESVFFVAFYIYLLAGIDLLIQRLNFNFLRSAVIQPRMTSLSMSRRGGRVLRSSGNAGMNSEPESSTNPFLIP